MTPSQTYYQTMLGVRQAYDDEDDLTDAWQVAYGRPYLSRTVATPQTLATVHYVTTIKFYRVHPHSEC